MNTLDRQVLEEGPRNAVVKLTGVLDSSDIYEVPAIPLSLFTNNDVAPVGPLIGLRVDHVNYSIGNGIEILLEWDALAPNPPQQITPLSGRGHIDSTGDGGFVPNLSRPLSGNINLKTTGYQPNSVQNFSIFLRLVKLYGR